jgi:hypothetical protein
MNSSTREAQELAKLPDRRPTAEARQSEMGTPAGTSQKYAKNKKKSF